VSEIIDRDLACLYESSLITSDSQREFNLVHAAVQRQLAPRDFLEHMWASEFIDAEWERVQLRRFKKEIVTTARVTAFRDLLCLLLEGRNTKEVHEFADRYHTNKAVRRKIERLMQSYGLSAKSADAEAFRQSIGDLAYIDRRLAELATRRDKILQRLEEYRAGLALPCAMDPDPEGH
jgi:hypothetical protein